MGRTYALASLENHVELYALSVSARKCRLKPISKLNLAKKIV